MIKSVFIEISAWSIILRFHEKPKTVCYNACLYDKYLQILAVLE